MVGPRWLFLGDERRDQIAPAAEGPDVPVRLGGCATCLRTAGGRLTILELGRRDYWRRHIPGAVFVDVERELSAPAERAGGIRCPAEDDFARSMGEAGIGDDVFVVAYGSLGGAERLWWLLRHFGHEACAVIELESWRGPLSSGVESCRARRLRAAQREGDTIELDELASRLGELVVVDARLPARYRGEPNPGRPRPRPDSRRAERALARAAARASGRRARRLLRLGSHRVRALAPAPSRRTGGPALPGVVVRVGAAHRAAGRAGRRELKPPAPSQAS